MPPKGTKRASPGAEQEKNPLQNVELGDEDAQKLQQVQREIARAELVLERQAQLSLIPVYQKRRQVVRTIEKFWPIALLNHAVVELHTTQSADQLALSYLEDLWVERDRQEPRCCTIEFYFKENPFFSDRVLKKEFKYLPPPAAANEKPDDDGITPSMLDFAWERDVKPSVIEINWKDESKALTKLYPRETDDEDNVLEHGSFFNFFVFEDDAMEIGSLISNDIFPDAIEYFLGTHGEEPDSEDEEDEDDESAEEIDLEKPRSKKRRV